MSSVTSLTSYFNTASFGDQNASTRNQKELSLTLDSAAHELGNWKTLISMSAGGVAFEGGQLAATALFGSCAPLAALPFISKAFSFALGAVSDTGITTAVNHALGNGGGDESFLERLNTQGLARAVGLMAVGQSFAVMQVMQGVAGATREAMCEASSQTKPGAVLHQIVMGLQCHLGSTVSGVFGGNMVQGVEQRLRIKTQNMRVEIGNLLSASRRDWGNRALQALGIHSENLSPALAASNGKLIQTPHAEELALLSQANEIRSSDSKKVDSPSEVPINLTAPPAKKFPYRLYGFSILGIGALTLFQIGGVPIGTGIALACGGLAGLTFPLFKGKYKTISAALLTTGVGFLAASALGSGLAIACGGLGALSLPLFKGNYKLLTLLPLAACLAASAHFGIPEQIAELTFLGAVSLFTAREEVWVRRRLADTERIHFWQHNIPREKYMRTHATERTAADYREIMGEVKPVEVNPADASWSLKAISRDESGAVKYDKDGYPETFVRFIHDAAPKPGLIWGNYLYHQLFDTARLTAVLEQICSTARMDGIYKAAAQWWLRKDLKTFLVDTFKVSYPERFGWDNLKTFGNFFTRPLIVPQEGLPVAPGQAFHDGVLDVIARGKLLKTGIRIAGKGPIVKRPVVGEDGITREQVVADDVTIPLDQLLGRASKCYEGDESLTVIATYLSPRHWHQALSPVSGTVKDIEVIEGFRHTVDPALRQVSEDRNFGGKPGSLFQSENARVVLTIDSDDYGIVSIVFTAAAMVSTSRLFVRPGHRVNLGELIHEYRFGSHNTIVFGSKRAALAPNLVPGRQVYVRGTQPEGVDGITELFVPRDRV